MPYTPTAWTNGTTPVNATNMNHLETQYTESTLSFNPDLFTAFVLSGLVCTKDGTTASQLDVTAGDAYLQQSDGTLRQRKPSSTNFSTAGNLSTTMYLDLNPDGTWSWGTTHSGVANHLTICTVTTDGSGNIATVTDARVLVTTMFSGMSGNLGLPMGLLYGAGVSGSKSLLAWDGANNQNVYWTPQSGAANGQLFIVWNGSAQLDLFSLGGQFGGALSWIDNTGAVHYGAGHGGSHSLITFDDTNHENTYWTPQSGVANGHTFVGWNGTALTVPFSVNGQFGGAPAFVDSSGRLTSNGASLATGGQFQVNASGVVTFVGNQASAGSFGVPVVVAQAINQSVTSTAFTTIAGFAVPADGFYRCSITFTWSNVANSNITAEAQYTDPNTSSTSTVFFMSAGNGSLLNALSVLAGTITYATYPVTVYCKGGTNVNIIFRDSAGTPSDHVTAMIERLS